MKEAPENVLAKLRRWQRRQVRFTSIAATVLCVELVALGLLYGGFGAVRSLAITLGAGMFFLAFPAFIALVVMTVQGVSIVLRGLAQRVIDRRSYRFSFASFMILVILLSIGFAWYGHRWRSVNDEQRKLDGTWQLVGEDGKPLIQGTGEPALCEFKPGRYSVDPTRNPARLDFYTTTGTSHAIYRWEGKRLRIVQVSEGLERPASFDIKLQDIPLKPNATGLQSASYFLLERLPDQGKAALDD